MTSGCAGWEPDKARLLTDSSILGEWKQLPNPCIGEKADKTFGGQGIYIFLLQGKEYLLLNGLIGGNLINFVYITVPV